MIGYATSQGNPALLAFMLILAIVVYCLIRRNHGS